MVKCIWLVILVILFWLWINIFLVVITYVLFREGRNFLNSLKRIDIWSIFGGLVLSLTMFGWVYAITTTTIAVTLWFGAIILYQPGQYANKPGSMGFDISHWKGITNWRREIRNYAGTWWIKYYLGRMIRRKRNGNTMKRNLQIINIA